MCKERSFNLPTLDGISQESVTAHLGLYSGYVKNVNSLLATQDEILKEPQKNALALAETLRRLPFEFDGMRLHELYFEQWEGGAIALDDSGALGSALTKQFGSVETWKVRFRNVGTMRGVGWAVLYFEKSTGEFLHTWIDQHHQGLLAGLPIILILDAWEHAYLAQFGTGGRTAYIDAWMKNLNWGVIEGRFNKA